MAERSSSRPQAMSKSMRLRRRPDFLAVQSSGRKIHGSGFVALVVRATSGASATDGHGPAGGGRSPAPRERNAASSSPSTIPPTGRVGFTVTKRIGNAVTRNRIRRRAREWLRRHGWIPAGLDVVFIAKEAAVAQSSAALAEDLRRMVGRIASC
jgi:ribonuclease P protein component